MSLTTIKRGTLRSSAWPVIATVSFDVGDLLWYDSANSTVKKLSDFTWDSTDGSAIGSATSITRRNAIPRFVGVALEARTGREPFAGTIDVATSPIVSAEITSATPKIGTLVGFAKASGNTLENQKLVAVVDPADACGIVVKRYTSATTQAEVRLFSAHDFGGLQGRIKQVTFTAATTLMNSGANAVLVNDYSFRSRVKIVAADWHTSVVLAGITNFVLYNGANALDDKITVTTTSTPAGGDGTVAGSLTRAFIDDATSYDLFEHDDLLDIKIETARTGGGDLIIHYIDMPLVA